MSHAAFKARVARKIAADRKARAASVTPTRCEPNTGHPGYQSLEGFVRHTMPEYEWNWHHRIICTHLDMLLAGSIRRLMVFAPPRSGKSELVSRRFPAYALGRQPDWNAIGGSHTSGLAGEMCQDVQDIIDTPEYAEVFPGVRLRQTGGRDQDGARRTQHLFDVVGHRGVYRSVGTRTRLSGHGMTLGILDDPIGDADEAFSPTYRQRVWSWYTSTFRSRKSQDARILVTLTRWHKDDLAGRLMQRMEDDARADQWTILRFPALAEGAKGSPGRSPGDDREEGEPLWPARVGQFDLDTLASDRASMGSFQFAALMQQRPSAAEGARFKEEWFTGRTWRSEGVGYRLHDGRFIPASSTWRLVIVDPAATDGKGSDWTAIVAFIICASGEILVQDVVRERLPLEQIVPRLKAVWEMYRPLYVGIEAVGFQRFLTKEGGRLMPQADIRGIEPQGKGKLVRAFPAIARAEAGKILLPDGGASWARYFIEELCEFTGLGDTHDDVVDCVAYCVQQAGDPAAGRGMPLIVGRQRGQA
jgi:predicted phage terminase large subunit-like protein